MTKLSSHISKYPYHRAFRLLHLRLCRQRLPRNPKRSSLRRLSVRNDVSIPKLLRLRSSRLNVLPRLPVSLPLCRLTMMMVAAVSVRQVVATIVRRTVHKHRDGDLDSSCSNAVCKPRHEERKRQQSTTTSATLAFYTLGIHTHFMASSSSLTSLYLLVLFLCSVSHFNTYRKSRL